MKISVIIPAYNSEKFISQTLDCLLAQTLKDIQIIVVNDGSVDSTQAVVQKYCEHNKNILLISQPNSGVSAARNNGIEHAQGEYLYFLDSDDLISTDTLEKVYNTMRKRGAQLGIFSMETFGFGSREMNPIAQELSQLERIDCADKRLLWSFLLGNKCFSTAAVKEHSLRFPDTRYSEDGVFIMQYIHTVRPVITGIEGALYRYRKHPGSVTQRVNSALLKDYFKSMDMIYSSAEDFSGGAGAGGEAYLQEVICKHYSSLINEFYRLLWSAEDEQALALIGERCAQLKSRMSKESEKKCSALTKDIERLVFDKNKIAASPQISVFVKKPCVEFVNSVYAQSMPLFEFITPDISSLPKKENIVVAENAKAARGKTVLKFSGNEVLDRRFFKVVSLLKRSSKFGLFPDFLIKIGASVFLKLKK